MEAKTYIEHVRQGAPGQQICFVLGSAYMSYSLLVSEHYNLICKILLQLCGVIVGELIA